MSQDDQDKQTLVKTTVAVLVDECIEPKIGDVKFVDIWSIEKVWSGIKEKLRGQEFDSEVDLQKEVAHHWNMFIADKCRLLMKKMPKYLKLVIDIDGKRIFGD